MSDTIPSLVLTKEEPLGPVTKAAPRQYVVKYEVVLLTLYYHLAGLYGLYVACTSARWLTICYGSTNLLLTLLGVTAGVHRLWSHRSYKAKWPVQLFLILCNTMASQNSVFHWARDHRLHHKYSDTDADPHNASRGFFYSHIGWLLVQKHPQVTRRGKEIDMSDLKSNPFVMFQYRHISWLVPLMAFILPTFIPVYLWGETLPNAWHINMLRYTISQNITFMINSVAHRWGYRTYDNGIAATQSLVLFNLTLGEGSHNYHHVFPTDYRTDGLGLFNVVTTFIDACAGLGWVYDRKVVDGGVVQARMKRTGDGIKYW